MAKNEVDVEGWFWVIVIGGLILGGLLYGAVIGIIREAKKPATCVEETVKPDK
jgi:hypothetical protein